MKRKILLCSLLVMAFMGKTVHAGSYIANDWETFKERTKEEIIEKYNAVLENKGTYEDGKSSTYYEVLASVKSPYASGKLTSDTHKIMTEMTNFYRYLVGVSPLKESSVHSEDLQVGALIRNFDFNHRVSLENKPSDMDEDLWNQGANATHNILAWNYTPFGAITGWMNEGYSLDDKTFDTTGHRQALIGKSVSSLQFGYAGSIAIGNMAKNENTSDLAYTAFPAPGFMPLNFVSAGSSAWNIILNSNILKINDASSVIVRVTDLKTNTSYDCTKENNKLQISGNELIFVQPTPKNNNYEDGSSYKVEVLNVEDIKARAIEDATISYTINFFDITKTSQEESEDTPENKTPTTEENTNNTNNNVSEEKNTETESTEVEEQNPQTGDSLGTYILLMGTSLFMLGTGFLITRKN